MTKSQKPAFLKVAILVFFSACLFYFSAGEQAALAAVRPGCVSGNCHSGMGTGKFVHGPVATGDCVFCHQPAGKHKFGPLPKNISVLCYKCHDKVETAQGAHPSVNGAQCTGCHSPHQSDHEYQLRSGTGLTMQK